MVQKPRAKISLVVAVDNQNGIGRDNQLLWHLPNDLAHFKRITSGHTVIMGRKTFESIGKPLPNRKNIILSRHAPTAQSAIESEKLIYCASLDQALSLVQEEDEVFIIGGGNIYAQSLAMADYIYLTRVDVTLDADTHFPELPPEQWNLVSREDHVADDRHSYAYSFIELERIYI